MNMEEWDLPLGSTVNRQNQMRVIESFAVNTEIRVTEARGGCGHVLGLCKENQFEVISFMIII